jgi:hypothetical protein
LSTHQSKGSEQGVVAQFHEHGLRLLQLLFVQDALQGDIAVAEFLKWTGRDYVRRE